MCGRYILSGADHDDRMRQMIDMCNRSAPEGEQIRVNPDREIRPGDAAPGLILNNHTMSACIMHWGFTNKEQGMVINARSESVDAKPTFRDLILKNRCVLPAYGYLEWRRGDGQKYLILPENRDVLYLAGLYRFDESGKRHFVVLTKDAFGMHKKIHSRMPVTIPTRDATRKWLRGEISLRDLAAANDAALQANALGSEQVAMNFALYSEA